jgi:hypothetical protein
MSAHTKGPWHAKVSTIVDGWKGDKQTIAIYSDSVLIAAYETNYIEHPDSNEENEANAHLMAAAPDLLEALQELFADGAGISYANWTHA